MKLRVLVADDELAARKRIVRLLEERGDVEVVATCTNAAEVVAQLARVRADVLLLDISMPGPSGLELKASLPDDAPPVVYVTAHDDHALEAFEVGALDYVVKPVTGARLGKAIDRVRAHKQPAGVRIPIETRAGVELVDPATIVCASFDGVLVTITTALTSWITTTSLKDLEERLPRQFMRVDRRHVLNLDEVARLEPEVDGGCQAITRTGARVPVSRQMARELRRRLAL